MQATVAKWGNSLALRLPRHLAQQVKLAEGSTVELVVDDDGSIRIVPARRKPTLAELLDGEPKREPNGPGREVDWSDPRGGEAW